MPQARLGTSQYYSTRVRDEDVGITLAFSKQE